MDKRNLDDLLKGMDVMRQSLDAKPEETAAAAKDALVKLEGLVDAVSIRRRLILMLRIGDLDAASTLIADRAPDAEWAEFAVELHTRRLDRTAVEATLEAIKSRPDRSGTIVKRSISTYGEWTLKLHSTSTMASMPYRSFYAVEPVHRDLFDSFLASALPVISNDLLVQNELASNLDKALAATFLAISAVRGRSMHVPKLMALITDVQFVNLNIALMVVDGYLPDVPLLPKAIRASNPADPFANVLAAAIEMRSGAKVTVVIEAALASVSKSVNPVEKLQAAMIGLDLALQDGVPTGESFFNRVSSIQPADDEITRVLSARINLVQSKPQDALVLAELLPSTNGYKELLISECYRALDDIEKSFEHYMRHALLTSIGAVLADAGARAFKLKRFKDAIACLRKLIHYYPETVGARNNLLTAYYNEDLLDDGVAEAQAILASDPKNIQARVQLGQLFLRLGKPDKSVETLRPLFSDMNMHVDAVSVFMDALDAAHLGDEQFEVAERFRANFWDRSEFLFRYLRAAYKAQDDAKSHAALMELNKLREQGLVSKDQMRLGTIDEIKEMLRGFQKQREESSRLLLQGRLPWTSVAFMENRPIFMDWYVRTQPMPWLVEEEVIRAQFAIYATNAFTSVRGTSAARVDPILMGADVPSVAIDYSSLVTLTELGVLPTLQSVFKQVYLPNSYREQVVEDLRRLEPMQQSRPTALSKLRKLLDDNKVERVRDYETEKTPTVDEYDPDKLASYVRLQDIRELLQSSGHLTSTMSQQFDSVIHDPRTTPATTVIKAGDRAIVRLITLQTLNTIGALEPLLQTIRVCLIDSDYESLMQDLREHAAIRTVLGKFDGMRSILESMSCIRYTDAPKDEASQHDVTSLPLDTYRVAKQLQIPVMADDRVIQAARLNETGRATDAFGIQQYLERLKIDGHITPGKHGELLLKLIEWRYRFLMVPPDVLVELAVTYKASLPGNGLSSVAKYIHDCMRDPGLFGGLEPTSPPMSMAVKLYLEWSTNIAKFLYLTWIDTRFNETEVVNITKWAATHLLPSSPASVAPHALARVAEVERTAVITMVVMNSGNRMDEDDRVSKGLKVLGDALGLTTEQVDEAVLEVVMYANRN